MSETVTLRTGIDAFADQDRQNVNYGRNAFLRLNGNSGASHQAQSFIYFKRPFDLGVTVQSAILKVRLRGTGWSGGPHVIAARRLTAKWKELTVTWNNRPTQSATNEGSESVTGGAAGDLVEIDVTAIMQDVAAGNAFYGFRLSVDTNGDKNLFSYEADNADYRPRLEVTWSLTPEQPTGLAPDGDRATSLAKPPLLWQFRTALGIALQSAFRARVDDTDTMASPIYDSGWVTSTKEMCDLAYNMLTANQSDIETDTTGFNAVGSALVRVTGAGNFQNGTAGLECNTNGGAADQGFDLGTGGSRQAVEPGKSYVFSAYLKRTAGGTVTLRARTHDGGGSFLTETLSSVATMTSEFVRHSVVFTADPTAATVELRIMTDVSQDITFLADAIQLSQSDGVEDDAWRPAFDGLTDDTQYYWDVQVRDDDSLESEVSDIASFFRRTHGVLAITSPTGGATEDNSPPIVHTFTGRTQAEAMYILYEEDEEGEFIEQTRRDREEDTNLSFTFPPRNADGKPWLNQLSPIEYKALLRVWDDIPREALPGDPGYVEDTETFVFDRAAGVTGTASLVVTDVSDLPAVLLTWTRASSPDEFALRVDNKLVVSGLDPADLFVSGTTYEYTYWGAVPGQEHTYEVEAVVNGEHSDTNDTEVYTSKNIGVWLARPATGEALVMLARGGRTDRAMEIGEASGVYNVVGRRDPVTITDTIRGYEGHIGGILADILGQTAEEFRDQLLDFKGEAGTRAIRLIMSGLNIRVSLGKVSVMPSPDSETYLVDFEFYQVDDFTFAVVTKR